MPLGTRSSSAWSFLAVIVVAVISKIGQGGEGTLGLEQRPERWPLPEFAVPDAAGQLEGDANIAQDDCSTSQVPCPEDARRTPACRISEPGAIRVCDLFRRPSLISFWFTKGGGDCVTEQDSVEATFRRYGGRVGFLSLNVRDDRDKVRDLIHEHHWRMPVGYRPRRRRRQPLSGRRLPDLRLRLSRRDPARAPAPASSRRGSSGLDSTRC